MTVSCISQKVLNIFALKDLRENKKTKSTYEKIAERILKPYIPYQSAIESRITLWNIQDKDRGLSNIREKDIINLFKLQKSQCYYCNLRFDYMNWSLE